jgi:Fic family protein
VPPPPDNLMDCLGEFENFLHDRSLPPLIHIALCHYQFEAIHPFLDGNGRVGRLLIMLLLVEQRMLPSPFAYIYLHFLKQHAMNIINSFIMSVQKALGMSGSFIFSMALLCNLKMFYHALSASMNY